VVAGRRGELLSLDDVKNLLAYPIKGVSEDVISRRVSKLREAGILGVYSYGPVFINRFAVLGKGHSSIIFLALHESYGDVALKVRRLDSKRDSLALEGYLMSLLKGDVAPKVYYFNDDFIVMEYINGVVLRDLLKSITNCSGLVDVYVKILNAALKLDMEGVEHLELSIPYKHVMIEFSGRVRIIDFESARPSVSPCNVCRVFSSILRLSMFRELCNLNTCITDTVRHLLKVYKSGRRGVFNDIVNIFSCLAR